MAREGGRKMTKSLLPDDNGSLWKCEKCGEYLTIQEHKREGMNNHQLRPHVCYTLSCFCSEVPKAWVLKGAPSTKRLPIKNRQE